MEEPMDSLLYNSKNGEQSGYFKSKQSVPQQENIFNKYIDDYNPVKEELTSELEIIQKKAKDMMVACNYVRKKHFKSNRLQVGEGSMFMNKGLTNRNYEDTILRKSLS
mmetsp:Transcript_11323/g.11349  ORF Transcript_11323/g.11349 Transcript_11323/m.11349 type:complete len:108 (-) Transcript_11323:20-343(-)